MTRLASPYLAPGFYDDALAKGRHRDIVGGRWDETGRIQMHILREAGLQPENRLLDIGAGSLRLGCKAVAYLHPGNYWATDASRALMLRGREVELPDPSRLPEDHLIEDAAFALPGVPEDVDFAIAFGVFTHLPSSVLDAALFSLRPRLPRLQSLLFTVFLAPEPVLDAPLRQPDGVVTHRDRPPYHFTLRQVEQCAHQNGWSVSISPITLPRGQILVQASPTFFQSANQA